MLFLFGWRPHKGQMNKKRITKYQTLYIIGHSEKWGKKIQAAAYNGARMVPTFVTKAHE